MKKIIFSILSITISLGSFSQLPVSQVAENKHVILEEFTGIHCGYCPDGHARANNLTIANPNLFHQINIHSGYYATPGAGEPDFRTIDGASITAAAAPSGYPNGGINRGNGSGWSMSRGSWSNSTSELIEQSSYVNIAVEGSVDFGTRQLTVDVQVFYTGTASTDTEYLSLAILQNNIAGPQSDYGDYFPTGWKCPEKVYKHQHVFRMFVNPNNPNGDPVSTITGAVVNKQYQLVLPAIIGDVELELGELELVAFITESGNLISPIVSGNDGPLDVVLGAGKTKADLYASANHIAPSGLCNNQFIPKMDIINNSRSPITGIDVTYYINNTPTTVNLASQTIDSGITFTHAFNPVTLVSGSSEVYYEVTLSDETKTDLSALNNSSCKEFIYIMPSVAFGTSLTEEFERISYGNDNMRNTIHLNPDDIRAYVVNRSISDGVSWHIGGYGKSTKSFMWDFYSISAGKSSSIIWEKLDFTNGLHQMNFDVAYAQYSNENDKIEVQVSTNCGETWTTVFNQAGSVLATHSPVGNNVRFYPSEGESDWASKSINLSPYNGRSEVMIKITGTSDWGNSAYIDNINISEITGINQQITENSISIYPNPTNSISTISFNLTENTEVKIQVYNTLGRLVFSMDEKMMNIGQQELIFNASELPDGIYYIKLLIADRLFTKKVSLLK